MKRANLHGILSYTMVMLILFVVPTFGQNSIVGSYTRQNFVLSDFGDGYDAYKGLIWKPTFSDYVVQAEEVEATENADGNAADPNAAPDANAADANAADANTAPDANTANNENAEDGVYKIGGNPDWKRVGVKYFQDVPNGITDLVAGPQKFVLGVKAEFTQQGYNWIELHPQRVTNGAEANNAGDEPVDGDQGVTAGEETDVATDGNQPAQAEDTTNTETVDGNFLRETKGAVESAPDLNVESTPFRIPFAGKASEITIWAWGGYYGWWVEAYIRDFLGYQYRLPLGDLLYKGWRQKRTGIPNNVVQSRLRLPATQTLGFEMLKLWSFPSERVDQFYVYFDLLQHDAIISTEVFNGKSLESARW